MHGGGKFTLDRNAPFYLQAIVNPKGDIWYKNQRLGVNNLGKLLKTIGEKAGLNNEKNVRNHRARKTTLNHLCERPELSDNPAVWP